LAQTWASPLCSTLPAGSRSGSISVRTEASISKEPELVATLEKLAKNVPGVKDVDVKVVFRENPL